VDCVDISESGENESFYGLISSFTFLIFHILSFSSHLSSYLIFFSAINHSIHQLSNMENVDDEIKSRFWEKNEILIFISYFSIPTINHHSFLTKLSFDSIHFWYRISFICADFGEFQKPLKKKIEISSSSKEEKKEEENHSENSNSSSNSTYDLIFDYTFFVAIPREMRNWWGENMKRLLLGTTKVDQNETKSEIDDTKKKKRTRDEFEEGVEISQSTSSYSYLITVLFPVEPKWDPNIGLNDLCQVSILNSQFSIIFHSSFFFISSSFPFNFSYFLNNFQIKRTSISNNNWGLSSRFIFYNLLKRVDFR